MSISIIDKFYNFNGHLPIIMNPIMREETKKQFFALNNDWKLDFEGEFDRNKFNYLPNIKNYQDIQDEIQRQRKREIRYEKLVQKIEKLKIKNQAIKIIKRSPESKILKSKSPNLSKQDKVEIISHKKRTKSHNNYLSLLKDKNSIFPGKELGITDIILGELNSLKESIENKIDPGLIKYQDNIYKYETNNSTERSKQKFEQEIRPDTKLSIEIFKETNSNFNKLNSQTNIFEESKVEKFDIQKKIPHNPITLIENKNTKLKSLKDEELKALTTNIEKKQVERNIIEPKENIKKDQKLSLVISSNTSKIKGTIKVKKNKFLIFKFKTCVIVIQALYRIKNTMQNNMRYIKVLSLNVIDDHYTQFQYGFKAIIIRNFKDFAVNIKKTEFEPIENIDNYHKIEDNINLFLNNLEKLWDDREIANHIMLLNLFIHEGSYMLPEIFSKFELERIEFNKGFIVNLSNIIKEMILCMLIIVKSLIFRYLLKSFDSRNVKIFCSVLINLIIEKYKNIPKAKFSGLESYKKNNSHFSEPKIIRKENSGGAMISDNKWKNCYDKHLANKREINESEEKRHEQIVDILRKKIGKFDNDNDANSFGFLSEFLVEKKIFQPFLDWFGPQRINIFHQKLKASLNKLFRILVEGKTEF